MSGKQGAIRYHRTLYCERCGKWSYRTRKAARRAARTLHPDDSGLQAYQCPHGDGLHHYGHWRYGPRGQQVTG
ncbi:MAG: hypothetical protein ACRDS1_00710 [Pseudonocardiaceae bacterium]